MKKLLLISLILLLQSFSSFGSPIGKGLICQCVDVDVCPSETHKWWTTFYFNENKVKNNVYYSEMDKIKVLGVDLSFRTTSKLIKIYGNDIKIPNYVLNRETLILNNKFSC